MRLSILLFACFVAAGCQIREKPPGTLDRETYLAAYCDLLQESLRGKNSGADPRTAIQNGENVLAKRGVTRAQFDSTTGWYNADVRRWKLFFDDAAKELELRELAQPHPAR